jgi:hypothetical protein
LSHCPFGRRLRPQLGQRVEVFHRIAFFRRLTCSMNIPAKSDDAMLMASCGGIWFIHPSIGRFARESIVEFG